MSKKFYMIVRDEYGNVIFNHKSGKAEYRNKGRSHEGMFKFRLLDDDGGVYFYGYSSSCDDEAAFEPLDYYGEAYGCTMIEYKNPETGEYEQL